MITLKTGPAFRFLRIVFFTQLAAQFILLIVTLILINRGEEIFADKDELFVYLTPLVVLSLLIGSRFMYKRAIKKGEQLQGTERKLGYYLRSNIIKWSMIEGANFFTIFTFFITRDTIYIILFIILVVFYLLQFPSRDKFVLEFRLEPHETGL
jgi:hypothetical protein